MAFGLVSTETTDSYRSLNARRKIFYDYPAGAAPLMGLLSMLGSEETDKDEFGWFERRFPVLRTATVASGTAPFLNGDGTTFTDGATMTVDVEYRVRVVSTAEFRPTHVLEIREVALNNAASYVDITGTVTEIISATVLKFRPDATAASVDNASTDNNSKTVAIIGNAAAQNARSGTGVISFPIKPTNFTQIFRTAFNASRTVLKGGLEFDKNGPYAMLAKENGLRHMIEMEKTFLWGNKHEVLVTDPETGDSVPEKKMGGVRYFLKQWEAADSIYRGGSGAAAVTANSDDNKRILDVQGTLTKADYRTYMARLFKVTSNTAYEKLCLCGGKHLATINALKESDIVRTTAVKSKERGWEFIVHTVTTLFGEVHYKVHPLFDEDPDLSDAGLYLDMGNLKVRPLTDSDTRFLKNRQENDRDGRKDEWLGELGLEVRFPESHMLILNAAAAA